MKIVLKNFYEAITPKYLQFRQDELEELTKSVKESDFKVLEENFHKIAGSGGSYGLPMITELGHHIEKAAAEKNIDTIREKFAEYEAYLASIELEFIKE